MCPYASCNDCCIVHSTSACADPELVGGSGGWSCMLLMHPALTCSCSNAGPDLCTLNPELCTLCLRWLSLAATYGAGVFPSAGGTNAPLAHMAVSPIATCTSGVVIIYYTSISIPSTSLIGGNWCFSPSHCMTDCVDVLFYRQ